ncbi:MAG: hypothetical protein ABEJ79_10640 [Halolamina sp.]
MGRSTDAVRAVAMSPRSRATSALAWGGVALFTVLVVGQGALLVGVDLPFGYATLFAVGLVAGVVVAASAYLAEPRLARKGRT